MPLLIKLGAVEEEDFEKEWKKGIPVDEVFDKLIEKIKGLQINQDCNA